MEGLTKPPSSKKSRPGFTLTIDAIKGCRDASSKQHTADVSATVSAYFVSGGVPIWRCP